VSLAAAALLDGEADALTRRAVELAIEGDSTALKLCLERILAPRRERVVRFALPPIDSAADIARAMGAVTAAVADGALTPGEAGALAQIVDTFVRAIETGDFLVPRAPGKFLATRGGGNEGGRWCSTFCYRFAAEAAAGWVTTASRRSGHGTKFAAA
jgi:hypothetical protein